MKFWISVFIITVAHLFVYCSANLHAFGRRDDYGTHRIYHRTIIDDANKVPKDYTVIFKCIGFKYQAISYLQIDVNTESSGFVNISHGNFEARIEIKNAFNVTATLESYVSDISQMNSRIRWIQEIKIINDQYARLFDYKENYGKSFTFIYKKNSKQSLEPKPFVQNAIGRRRKGDELLHFESRNVTNISRFPSRAFEYSGSEYITYVGFSFNSPTAMAMINTSYFGDQEFNAVAYDMNTEHFVANMSVYGIRSEFRPPDFEGLI